jgi:hypothetical protein
MGGIFINRLRKWVCALTALALLLALASCGGAKGGIQTGTWSADETVFTNEWSNIRFTVPEGYRAYSAEEVQAVVGAGADMLVNEGSMNQTQADISQMRSAYDFMVSNDISFPSVFLMYENLNIQTLLMGVSPEEYFDALVTQMMSVESFGYEEVSRSDATLAGESWFVGTVSASGGMLYQDYFIRKLDGAIAAVCLTYSEDTKDQRDLFVGAFEKIN